MSHLGSVVTLMKLSHDWPEFMAFLDRIHPRWHKTLQMDLDIYERLGL